jgi:hypothetical protein
MARNVAEHQRCARAATPTGMNWNRELLSRGDWIRNEQADSASCSLRHTMEGNASRRDDRSAPS